MNRILRRSSLIVALAFLSAVARAVVPAHSVSNGAVHLEGVGPDNPIIYDNDWWFDVFDNNYLWAQASLGRAQLRGNIVSRDMWDSEKGYLYTMQQCVEDAWKAIRLARESGLRGIPDPTSGSARVLVRPVSGGIEDTVPLATPGSRLIVAEARAASPAKPLLVVSGGPLTTVANALLTDPDIAPNLVVFNLTVAGGYNGNDSWATYVVARKARLVDWATGTFWDRNSVFSGQDFDSLPANPLCDYLRRLIASDLGQANQLGDGAALVWLWRNDCWRGVKLRRAVWHGQGVSFEDLRPGESADVLDIPKASTDLKASRDEFFRVLGYPAVYGRSSRAGTPDTRHFELRIYEVTAHKLDAVQARFRDHIGPIRVKYGIETLGYWTTTNQSGGDVFVYLIAGPTEAEFRESEKAFGADPAFKAAYAASQKANGQTVDRIVSYPLVATDWSPRFELRQSDPSRAFELRVYDVVPEKMAAYLANYRDARLKVFERHGFANVGFWTTVGTNHPNKFVLLLAHRDADTINRSKSAYHADPEWKRVVDDVLKPRGLLTTNVVSWILTPTAFSPLR